MTQRNRYAIEILDECREMHIEKFFGSEKKLYNLSDSVASA